MSSDSTWRDALAAVGARIAPLQTLDDTAGFFLSCASIVHGVPNRDVNLIRHMGGTFPATLIQALLDRVQEMPRVSALLDLLPARDGMQLITSRSTCVVCGCGHLVSDSKQKPFSARIMSACGVKRDMT